MWLNNFTKILHNRCFIGFWVRLCILLVKDVPEATVYRSSCYRKGCDEECRKIYQKTPVTEPLFTKDSTTGVLLWILQRFFEQFSNRKAAADWFWHSKFWNDFFIIFVCFGLEKIIRSAKTANSCLICIE